MDRQNVPCQPEESVSREKEPFCKREKPQSLITRQGVSPTSQAQEYPILLSVSSHGHLPHGHRQSLSPVIWMDTCVHRTQHDDVIVSSGNLEPLRRIAPQSYDLASMKRNNSQWVLCIRIIIMLPLETGQITVEIGTPEVLQYVHNLGPEFRPIVNYLISCVLHNGTSLHSISLLKSLIGHRGLMIHSLLACISCHIAHCHLLD